MTQLLEACGIRSVANHWLKSYLTDRLQYVSIDDCNSELLKVTCGVPQGSLLGPKLFLMYINDIGNISSILKCILFADDTNICCSGKDHEQLNKDITIVLQKLHDIVWFSVNRLSLNVAKTNYMLFTNCCINSNIDIKIDNKSIDRVYSSKLLGALIDHKLNWKKHVSLIKAKVSTTIAVVYRARYVLDKKCLFMLYCALVLPYISYCCEVWGSTYKTYCCEVWGSTYKTIVNSVFILQKKVIRLIYNETFLCHTNRLFCDLGILKLPDIIKLRISIVMFKAKNKLLSHNLQQFFATKYDSMHVTRQSKQMKYEYARIALKSMCISVHGVILWNSYDKI